MIATRPYRPEMAYPSGRDRSPLASWSHVFKLSTGQLGHIDFRFMSTRRWRNWQESDGADFKEIRLGRYSLAFRIET